VYETANRLVERARRGEGPAFLECLTYRYFGHHVGDINREYYRSKAEEQDWVTSRDPLNILADKLIAQGHTDQTMLDLIHSESYAEIEAGAQFAIDAPYPAVGEVTEDVYA